MIVGLTGGIGSGKSTVARMFRERGVPVYIADEEAKRLMAEDRELQEAILAEFGRGAYHNGVLQRQYLAERVFSDPEQLQKLNNLVHPRVARDFREWYRQQQAPYVIRESAILYESNSYQDCKYVIVVSAPEDVRIARVLQRDHTTESAVRDRMAHQWPQEQKESRADFVIQNLDLVTTEQAVDRIHSLLIKKNELD